MPAARGARAHALDAIPEDGSFAPAQRSMGWGGPLRVAAAGAMLALAVGFGFAWGSSSRSAGAANGGAALSMDAYYDRLYARDAAKAQGRQQKLWQGALSASLAKKIVRKQVAGGAALAGAAASAAGGEKAAPDATAKAPNVSPAKAEERAKAPAEAQAKAAPAKVLAKSPAKVLAKAAPAKAAQAKAAQAKAAPAAVAVPTKAKAPLATAKAPPGAAAPSATEQTHGTGKLFDAFAAAAAAHPGGQKRPAELPASDSEKLALTSAEAGHPKLRALAHLSAKAASGSALTGAAAAGEAQKKPAPKAKAPKAKAPKRGSQEWERQSDANFFDSLDKSHTGSEEKEIRKIKDRALRRAKEHELREREEQEKVHLADVKARDQQRNAELAAKKYTQSAFKDMDKHLTHINDDSVTGFKTMEAKELASEVERDHPNESAQQIAARAMKLLGMVMKDSHGSPQVGAVQNNVSPLGPMGVAPQVGM